MRRASQPQVEGEAKESHVFEPAALLTHSHTAPVKALRQAVSRGQLGDLNPTPWAFMLGNCLGWIAYSFLLQNLFIFFANAPGFLLAVWFNLCAAKLQYQTHRATEMRRSLVQLVEEEQSKEFTRSGTLSDKNEGTSPDATMVLGEFAKTVLQVTTQEMTAPAPHENLVVAIVVIWTATLSILGFASTLDERTKELIVGFLVNVNVMFFYGAPLSKIFTVLKTKSSSSIHIPTMVTNTLNAVFWTAYGSAVADPFLYVPNGMGALFGGCQILLLVLFPRKKMADLKEAKIDEGVKSIDVESTGSQVETADTGVGTTKQVEPQE